MDRDAIQAAVRLLTEAGWRVVPPDEDQGLPEPAAGQTWVSPKKRVEPRTIYEIAPNRSYPWAGKCIYFRTPSDPLHMKWPRVLTPESWRAWAKKAEARPVRNPTP
jgi:hypothetical protein